jgi:hypothetical protein
LRVRNAAGRYDAGPVSLLIDSLGVTFHSKELTDGHEPRTLLIADVPVIHARVQCAVHLERGGAIRAAVSERQKLAPAGDLEAATVLCDEG